MLASGLILESTLDASQVAGHVSHTVLAVAAGAIIVIITVPAVEIIQFIFEIHRFDQFMPGHFDGLCWCVPSRNKK